LSQVRNVLLFQTYISQPEYWFAMCILECLFFSGKFVVMKSEPVYF
jgi:hypothetical protein